MKLRRADALGRVLVASALLTLFAVGQPFAQSPAGPQFAVVSLSSPAPAPPAPRPTAQQAPPENLHVLAEEGLIDEMLGALQGLGLPRRGGRACLHCHVGSMDEPRDTWDYASDAKPTKAKARAMFAMVKAINGEYLPTANTDAERQRVTCYTCHAGRVNPRPLPEVLLAAYETGGVEELTATYREARERYFGADAYDFRVGTLMRVAGQLVLRGEFQAAVAVDRLNVEYHDDPAARGGLIRTLMLGALAGGGIDAMLERYEQLKGTQPASAFTWSVLDSLGWGLFRAGQQEAGVALFELNLAEHPDDFVPHESLAWAVLDLGDGERALEIARAWLDSHPGHQLGTTLLRQLEEGA